MKGSSRDKYVYGLAGVSILAVIGLGWKFSRTDATARAASAAQDSVTLPPLDRSIPPPPTASREPEIALTSEQRRMARYDKDDDGAVTLDEYLASRRKAFAKLDADSDGKLSFDEYAIKTIEKYKTADANNNGKLSDDEFASTAQKRSTKKVVDCPPEDKRPEDKQDEN